MPEQKLTSPEIWLERGLSEEIPLFPRSTPKEYLEGKQKDFIKRIQNETLEVAAQECDTLNKLTNPLKRFYKENKMLDAEEVAKVEKNSFQEAADTIRSLVQSDSTHNQGDP